MLPPKNSELSSRQLYLLWQNDTQLWHIRGVWLFITNIAIRIATPSFYNDSHSLFGDYGMDHEVGSRYRLVYSLELTYFVSYHKEIYLFNSSSSFFFVFINPYYCERCAHNKENKRCYEEWYCNYNHADFLLNLVTKWRQHQKGTTAIVTNIITNKLKTVK